MTMNDTSFDRDAMMGAMMPPSLWPMRPTFFASTSLRFLRKLTADSASCAKSSVVAPLYEPVDLPMPRSSTRSTARPLRVR